MAAVLADPGRLTLRFQPVVDLATGVVAGYEAFTRFAGPPAAPPDDWFAAAHAAGRGPALEARAVAAALDASGALPPWAFLSVNVSPDALVDDAVQRAFAGDLRGIVVELTEGRPIDHYETVRAALDPLRRRGAQLAIDDAGSGFSSLQHITHLGPELIKADRRLVRHCDTDPTRAAVLETLGFFAARIAARLVAEGVERAEELSRLLALGVPLAQGDALGRPEPALGAPDPDAVACCRRHARLARDGELAALAVPAPTIPATAPGAEISRAALAAPAGRVVLVDERERPVAVADRDGRTRALCVTTGDRLVEVARRVAARPPADRFDAVVLCDARGHASGLVMVDRLLGALAGAVAAAPSRGD